MFLCSYVFMFYVNDYVKLMKSGLFRIFYALSLSLQDIIPLRYESFLGFPNLVHTYYLDNRCKCFTFLTFFCCVMDVFEWF